jgi:hypothetical protein
VDEFRLWLPAAFGRVGYRALEFLDAGEPLWLRQLSIRSAPTFSALSGMSAKLLLAARRKPFSSRLFWPPSWWKEFSPNSSAKLAGLSLISSQ